MVAADQARPSIVAATSVKLVLEPRTTVVLDGLLVAGGPLVLDEVGDAETRTVILRHCTLVPGNSRTPDGQAAQPGRASLIVLDPFAARRRSTTACVGPIVAVEGSGSRSPTRPSTPARVTRSPSAAVPAVSGGKRTVATAGDMSIGDGTTPAGEVDLHESTVVGGIHARSSTPRTRCSLAALPGGDPRKAAVRAQRRQVGCVRFSFVPEGSRTGKRYRCAPHPEDPAGVRRATTPRFTSCATATRPTSSWPPARRRRSAPGRTTRARWVRPICCTRRSARATCCCASTSTSASASRPASSMQREGMRR